ncbi:MAG: methionyl-tRNA formyltransferase [Dehalococcoidia bacterium]
MRIVVMGQAAFGRDVFEALRAAGEDVVGVSTPTPGSRPDPLHEAATAAGLPTVETPALQRDEPFERFAALQPDLLVFAFVTDIVRTRALETATLGAIEYHPSLLPLHRGRSAMNWSLIAGDERTGLTVFWVDAGIDTGPVLLQREVEVGPEDSVGSLYFERLYPMGVEALVEATRLVREGRAPRVEQDHSLATYEPACEAEHGRIDWMHHSSVVFNLIRGCDPQPGASTALRGEPLRLFDARRRVGTSTETPGTVIAVTDGRVEVAGIGGTIEIGRVQRAGEGKVAAGEVLQTGDVLERVS